MDEKEVGGGGAGYGGDPGEQFHRNEAISAVADDGFLGEEDDDYEDLYNDVNVGENFLQSLRRNEDNTGQRNEEVQDNKPNVAQPPPPPPQPQPQPQPLVEGGGVELPDEGASSGVPGRVEGYQNMGFRGNNNVSDVGLGRGAGGPVAAAGGGFRVELGQSSNKIADLEERAVNINVPNNQQMVHHPPPHAANIATYENSRNVGNMNGTGGNAYVADGVGGGPVGGGDGVVIGGSGGAGGGGTILFVGDLHWWTTDAELEVELCKYGLVKEVKFFDERASGKSKGYCQVEFFDPTAATACKEGMNGHIFNGRPCVVAYASPYTVKRMGEAQVNRNQQQTGGTAVNQPRRGPGDLPTKPGGVPSNIPTGVNHHGGVGGGDSNGRGGGFARGNWGRGNPQGGMNRGHVGPMRNRGGGMSGRGMAGNGFGPGVGGAPPMMHPQAMMGQGFDPAFAGHMGRMGNYGFPGGPTAPFPGILSSFGPVGNVGLPGVAPHVNPAFFGRGMPMGAMGMGPAPGVEGPNMGMWSDPNMGQWGGDDHGGRAGESSYGEEAASDHQYGEGSQERGQWPNAMKEKERGSERDWSGSSERRYRDDRGSGYERDAPREKDVGQDHEWAERRHRDDKDTGRDRQKDRGDKERERSVDHERGGGRERERERHRDDRDRYADHHRHRNREADYDDDWDRGRSSRSHGKSRVSHEEEHRSRSRDADYGKRRRLTSE